MLCAAWSLNAQNPPATVRQISLDEAVRLALEQNLDIKIGQAAPRVSQLRIDGFYGYYDPVFSSQASQNYNERTGNLSPTAGVASFQEARRGLRTSA